MKFIKKDNNVFLVPFLGKIIVVIFINMLFGYGLYHFLFAEEQLNTIAILLSLMMLFISNFYNRKIIFLKGKIVVKTYFPGLYFKEVNISEISTLEFTSRPADSYVFSINLKNGKKSVNIGGTYGSGIGIEKSLLPELKKLLGNKEVIWS